MKIKEFKSGITIFFTALALIIMADTGYSQQDSVCWLWYGGSDTIDVSIGQRVYLDFYVQTPPTVWVGGCHFCMGAQDQYIDSLLSHEDGVYYYPFTEWQIASFLEPQHSVEGMPEGWSSQSFMGIATFGGPAAWLHFETPTRVLTWVLHTANDSTNIGDDARAIGDEGLHDPQGSTNISDTLGLTNYIPIETFSIFHFVGGGYIDGVITNFSGYPIDSVSIVNDLTGKETFSNEYGEYHMGLYPGTHALTFTHPDYIELTVDNIVIIEDQTNQIDITLNQPGAISGVVTDIGGDPIMGVVVSATGQPDDTTDADGAYLFSDLDAGMYDLGFSHSNYIDTTVTGVQVQFNQETHIDITLNQLGAISGIVTNYVGGPISGVIVTTDAGGNDTTGIDGAYYLGVLEAGLYDVSFSHAGYVDTTVLDVEAQLNQETILDITLHRLGGIRGFVTDIADGEGIEAVYVLVIDTNNDDTTNASGLYTLSQIEPGVYDVSFSHLDYMDTTVTEVEVNYDNITPLDVAMGTTIGINDNYAVIPEIYSLNQNYPNPFNSTTCIKYGLPEDSYVIIEIYDLLGRQVETLINEFQNAGYHQTTWNAYDLTSGMYFYIIRADDFIERKSMMLLK